MAGYLPPTGFHFRVTFSLADQTDNDTRFAEVGGLNVEVGTEEFQEGGENRYSHRLPGRTKYGNLVLKRGFLKSSGLVTWIRDATENLLIEPVDILVELLNPKHEALSSWNVVGAYPIKWSVSDFKATENGYVTETLELAFRYFRPGE